MVPDDLVAVLRDGEGVPIDGALQRFAIAAELGVHRVATRRLIDPLGIGEGPPRLVDRHLVAVRIHLEHGLLAFAQQIGVLLHVLRGDGIHRLVVGEGIAITRALALIAVGDLRWLQAAVPGGDGAVGVAGAGSADRRQRPAFVEFRCLLF